MADDLIRSPHIIFLDLGNEPSEPCDPEDLRRWRMRELFRIAAMRRRSLAAGPYGIVDLTEETDEDSDLVESPPLVPPPPMVEPRVTRSGRGY